MDNEIKIYMITKNDLTNEQLNPEIYGEQPYF